MPAVAYPEPVPSVVVATFTLIAEVDAWDSVSVIVIVSEPLSPSVTLWLATEIVGAAGC